MELISILILILVVYVIYRLQQQPGKQSQAVPVFNQAPVYVSPPIEYTPVGPEIIVERPIVRNWGWGRPWGWHRLGWGRGWGRRW